MFQDRLRNNRSGLTLWLALLTLCLVAAACGGGGGGERSVTPVAAGPSTSDSAASTTNAPDDAEPSGDTEKPESSSTAAAGDTTTSAAETNAESATPTSTPSAERFADGTVVSAGGYEAKTPAVARGLLLEPEWTEEQQEAADVIHQYLDAMIETVTDKKPDTEIPTSMTDLERPDLNSAGLVQLDTQNLVRGTTKLNQYMVEPEGSESAYWVFDLTPVAGDRLQVAMCEYNQFDVRDLTTDEVIDDGGSTSFWDGQIAPTDSGWRMVTLLHQGSKKGRVGCASE